MKNIELIKSMDANTFGNWICYHIDNCDECEYSDKCYKGHTGVVHWLNEEVDEKKMRKWTRNEH